MDHQIITPSPRHPFAVSFLTPSPNHPLSPSLRSDHHLSREEKEAARKSAH